MASHSKGAGQRPEGLYIPSYAGGSGMVKVVEPTQLQKELQSISIATRQIQTGLAGKLDVGLPAVSVAPSNGTAVDLVSMAVGDRIGLKILAGTSKHQNAFGESPTAHKGVFGLRLKKPGFYVAMVNVAGFDLGFAKPSAVTNMNLELYNGSIWERAAQVSMPPINGLTRSTTVNLIHVPAVTTSTQLTLANQDTVTFEFFAHPSGTTCSFIYLGE